MNELRSEADDLSTANEVGIYSDVDPIDMSDASDEELSAEISEYDAVDDYEASDHVSEAQYKFEWDEKDLEANYQATENLGSERDEADNLEGDAFDIDENVPPEWKSIEGEHGIEADAENVNPNYDPDKNGEWKITVKAAHPLTRCDEEDTTWRPSLSRTRTSIYHSTPRPLGTIQTFKPPKATVKPISNIKCKNGAKDREPRWSYIGRKEAATPFAPSKSMAKPNSSTLKSLAVTKCHMMLEHTSTMLETTVRPAIGELTTRNQVQTLKTVARRQIDDYIRQSL